ncbi:undecaprenyl-phosphate glucose phosphotransferase [Parvibaculum sp.]|uniref:undecaprenyl-phosphate glucose phosphotransferase n=1 Tax=Parvibaculum sp. TaxID=2024848 RepID=UPI00320E9E5B
MREQGTGWAVGRASWAEREVLSAAAVGHASLNAVRTASRSSRPFIRSKRVIADSVAAFDFLVVVVTCVMAKWAYVDRFLRSEQDIGTYLAAGLIGASISFLSLRNQNLYIFDTLVSMRGTVRRIVLGLAIAAVSLISAAYVFKISAHFSRGWFIIWFALSAALLLSVHLVVSALLRRWTRAGYFARRIAIYGGGEIAGRLIERLNFGSDGPRLIGVFDDQPSAGPRPVAISGGLSDLISLGQAERIDEVVIAVPLAQDRRIGRLVEELAILPADIRLCPDMTAFSTRPTGVVHYDGVPVLEVVRRPLDNWGPVIKVIEDRILAALLLAAVSPVLLLIAMAIRLESEGPVLFRQRRHGFNHQVFTVLKFRTMRVAEDGPVVRQAQPNDSRVTRVGRFLRRTSLDELPQLINVLRGEMSLVGPRPHALAHNEHFSTLVEHYARRHKMRPGMTGWAQVNGCRGETDTQEKMRRRVELDLYYIENWSLWFDIRILALTPFLGLFHRNAY